MFNFIVDCTRYQAHNLILIARMNNWLISAGLEDTLKGLSMDDDIYIHFDLFFNLVNEKRAFQSFGEEYVYPTHKEKILKRVQTNNTLILK